MIKIEHIALWAQNIDRICKFYQKYFGAKIGELYINSKRGFYSRFIEFEKGSRLEVMNQGDLKHSTDNSHFGYAHISISVGSRESVDNITKQMELDRMIIQSYPRITGDGYYESTVLDPEGNIVEITI